MNKHDFITIEESKDMLIGKPGTAERDAYEEDIKLYAIGAAIRETRKQQNLTQEELGQMVGVQKAQISRIENGSVEPGAGMFLRIISALGLRFEVLQPMAIG